MDVKPPVEVTSSDSPAPMFVHLVPEDVGKSDKALGPIFGGPTASSNADAGPDKKRARIAAERVVGGHKPARKIVEELVNEAKADAEILVYVIGELKQSVEGNVSARFREQNIDRETRVMDGPSLKLAVATCSDQLSDVSIDIAKRRSTLKEVQDRDRMQYNNVMAVQAYFRVFPSVKTTLLPQCRRSVIL